MSKRKSQAWDSFKKINSDQAKCTIPGCDRIISCKGGSTTAMMNHLKTHNIERKSDETPANMVKSSTSQTVLNFVRRESLNEILAKCAAKDGFSFRSIVKSEAIRGYVNSRNYVMPKVELL
jgi:hypothetical protein